MNETIRQVLNQFGIDGNESIRQGNKSNLWIINDRLILKSFSTDKEKAEKVAQLNALLHQVNAPVAKLYPTKATGLHASVEGNFYVLTDKLPGKADVRIYEGDSKKRAYSLGRNLAALHLAMQKIDGKVELWDNNIMDELHGWILNEIREKQIPVKPEVIQYCINFADLYHLLPRQIIHRDPHGRNMSMENDEITGIFDFDLCQINSRVFDMCYAFQPNENDYDKWLIHRPYFFSGYHDVSPISKNEMDAYPYMCVLLELLCVAFWSTCKKEDKLAENNKHVHWLYSARNEIRLSESDLIHAL